MKPDYQVDFEKVKTVEDVILILEVLHLGFGTQVKGLEKIIHLLKPYEDEPN
jgi:hypothetical protein